MPEAKANLETASLDHAVEQKFSIIVAGEPFAFSKIVPRYIYGALTREDWHEIGREINEFHYQERNRGVMCGWYFAGGGRNRLCATIEAQAGEIIYTRFRRAQEKAGNEAWQVPATLQGEVYAV